MILPMINFPKEKIKLKLIYENIEELESIKEASKEKDIPSKIKEVYGPLYFPKAPNHRPYIFGSLVLTLDGKLGFEKGEKSTLISKGNVFDPEGGLADLWIVNMLRTYCDGIVFGGKTLNVEDNITGHIYDGELQKDRINTLNKPNKIPWNIVLSRSGSNIPLDHKIFNIKEIPSCIITSKKGYENIKNKIPRGYMLINCDEDLNNIYNKLSLRRDEILVLLSEDNSIDTLQVLNVLKIMGIENLLIESPTYMYSLMDEGLLDETFINYSGIYGGGNLSVGNDFPFKVDRYPGGEILSIHIHSPYFLYNRVKLKYHNI